MPKGRPGSTGLPLRVRRRAFGLHLIAENVKAPLMLVERPTREELARLLERERFDLIGIGLCSCELSRARELARVVRLVQPSATLMLGGPGAAAPGIEQALDADLIAAGEGVTEVRRFLGEDEDAPVRLPSVGAGALSTPAGQLELAPLVAAVGGPKGRRRLFEDGDALFGEARRLSAEMGAEAFVVLDEGFLADLPLAKGFLAAMEREGRAFELMAFARPDDLLRWSPEDLVRLGVFALLVTAEAFTSRHVAHFRALRASGVAVHATVVCEAGNAEDALGLALSLEVDAAELAPNLALAAEAEQLLELPDQEPEQVGRARASLVSRQGSRLLRLARTLLDGYRAYEFSDDAWLRRRSVQGRARLANLRLLISPMSLVSEAERALQESVSRDLDRLLGPASLGDKALALTSQALREVQGAVRRAIETPAAPVCHYRWGPGGATRRPRYAAD